MVFLQGYKASKSEKILHDIKRIHRFAKNIFDEEIPIITDDEITFRPERTQVVLFGTGFTQSQLFRIHTFPDIFVVQDCADFCPKHALQTTFESMIFECIVGYKDKEFKDILKLAKDRYI